tara:strand:+ start:7589 stop:8161 length:573 start_codon:yes stop_codon:yes gene_type:complete
MSEKAAGENGEGEELTEEEIAIRAMPHPGREGSAEITARRLLNHEMNDVAAFESKANEASIRFELLQTKLRDSQNPPARDFQDSSEKHTAIHQMLDLRKSLGKKKVDSTLRKNAAYAALNMNCTLAQEHERLKHQIASVQAHVKKKTHRGNWDDAVDGFGVNKVTTVTKNEVAKLLASGETEGDAEDAAA